jgi:GT2 family glycosyltransferase
MIPRVVVDKIGLPTADFFIWFDDYEYSLRLMEQTDIQVELVPEAVFNHDMGQNARVVSFLGIRSVRSDLAAWKIYYGARNQFYTLLRTRRNPMEVLLFGAVHARLMLMDAFYGPERMKRIFLRTRGLFDGLLGRLGKRV